MSRSVARRSDRGLVLLSTLLMSMLALAGLVLTSATRGLLRVSQISREVERERAMAIAESGIDAVQVFLNADAWTPASVLDWSIDGVDNDGDGLLDEGDESLRATSAMWASDGIDNDGDGSVDESDERVVRVTSTVTLGRTTYRMTGWLRRLAFLLPAPTGAAYLNDPLAQVRMNGNSFAISGWDWSPSGGDGPAPSVYGISVNGEPAAVAHQLSENQLDNITGIGGQGSIGQSIPPDPFFIQQVVDLYTPLATTVLNEYQGTYTGNLGNWETGDFQIVKSNGNLEIGGGGSGAGILLVDGNLSIKGGWSFKGYIFVTGTVTLSGSAKQKKIEGALLVGGDVQNSEDLTIDGSASIYYSSEVLQVVRNAFSNYRRAAIVEG